MALATKVKVAYMCPQSLSRKEPHNGLAVIKWMALAAGSNRIGGYAVAEGMPVGEHRLPCCGIGCGWFLFIIGFFLAGIPWYFAAILLICCRNVEPREKPGYVACSIAAVLAIIATIFGVSKLND